MALGAASPCQGCCSQSPAQTRAHWCHRGQGHHPVPLPSQLYRASALFETIRHEAQLSTDYKLSLFDLQTSSYQALQRVLVSLGKGLMGTGLSSLLALGFDLCS